MDHLLWALALGVAVVALTVWLFVVLGKREKKLAFKQMEAAALEKGDESLTLLLQQCQNEEEREIVYNFAKEQLEKDERLEREKNSRQEALKNPAAISEPQEEVAAELAPAATAEAAEAEEIGKGTAYENDPDPVAAEAIMENEAEYTRIVDKNSLI